MEKVRLQFHENQFKIKETELTNLCKQRNEALETVKRITNDQIKELDIDKVGIYLNNQTGFFNAEFSANAQGVKEEYEFIKTIVNHKHKDDDFIELKNGKYWFDKKELEETYTTYLSDDSIEHYHNLQALATELNKLPKPLRRCINLNAEYITINKQNFAALFQMLQRELA
jgi:hypothetical protein